MVSRSRLWAHQEAKTMKRIRKIITYPAVAILGTGLLVCLIGISLFETAIEEQGAKK
jgi:hypothetical protein